MFCEQFHCVIVEGHFKTKSALAHGISCSHIM